jgi:peptidoglycan hydrolase-like protein with peptidoglycan-binding domain
MRRLRRISRSIPVSFRAGKRLCPAQILRTRIKGPDMNKLFAMLTLLWMVMALVLPGSALAQQIRAENVWVQVEAHPSLSVAQSRAEAYAGRLADVVGFSLGGSWYGILLGPYTPQDAEEVLRVYRQQGQIPSDSFLSRTSSLGRQFWPGDGVAPQTGSATVLTPLVPAAQTPAPEPQPSDETPAQARRSEQLLTADERKELQIALQAAGFYNSTIDGAFGRGTRASMSDWQAAFGYETSGVLTTAQRKVLMDQYNAPLISVGMKATHNDKAGIALQIPTKEVAFARYEPPFAHYDSTGDLGVRVLLISQPGNRTTLYGLFDIMQTLEIVPLEGPRERNKDSFTLEGRGNGIVSYTQASLKDDEIKGFTLVWPAGDEERRIRVLSAMKASFERLDGVLDPAAGAGDQQSVDLVSGLEVRKPRLSRSGFFVDTSGSVVTSAESLQSCTRITLDSTHRAELAAVDNTSGLALLRPAEQLAPLVVARLSGATPRLQSEVAVAGFSYGGVLGAPTLTYGTLADIRGLQGEEGIARLALNTLPGDVGGPVVDATGSIIGALLPAATGAQQLPEGVSFAARSDAIRDLLSEAGIEAESSGENTPLNPDAMTRLTDGMTVLVNCWD